MDGSFACVWDYLVSLQSDSSLARRLKMSLRQTCNVRIRGRRQRYRRALQTIQNEEYLSVIGKILRILVVPHLCKHHYIAKHVGLKVNYAF